MEKFTSKIPTLAEVSKHPFAWVLLIIGVFAGGVSQQWMKSSERININCENEKVMLREQIKYLESENKIKDERLINLYDDVINSQFQEIDSMARKKIGNRSKAIIENNKKNGRN